MEKLPTDVKKCIQKYIPLHERLGISVNKLQKYIRKNSNVHPYYKKIRKCPSVLWISFHRSSFFFRRAHDRYEWSIEYQEMGIGMDVWIVTVFPQFRGGCVEIDFQLFQSNFYRQGEMPAELDHLITTMESCQLCFEIDHDMIHSRQYWLERFTKYILELSHYSESWYKQNKK